MKNLDNILFEIFGNRNFDMDYINDIKIALDTLQKYSPIDLKEYSFNIPKFGVDSLEEFTPLTFNEFNNESSS